MGDKGDPCRMCGDVVGHMQDAYVVRPGKIVVSDDTVVRTTMHGSRTVGVVCTTCWRNNDG